VEQRTAIIWPPEERVLPPSTVQFPDDEIPETGEAIFASQLELIDRVIAWVSHRNRLNTTDSEDFASHARLKLIEDDYAILRKFQRRSSLKTFLNITLQRIYIDYLIAARGKWRPSAAALELGHVAILLEKLLFHDGYTVDQAFEILTTNHGFDVTRAYIETVVTQLPVRPKRGEESDDELEQRPSGASADVLVSQQERRRAAERILRVLREQLALLSEQDRLIVRLHFEEGMSFAQIAKLLQLDQKSLYPRKSQLLQKLQDGLVAAGVSRVEVRDLLGEPVDVTGPDGRERDARSPSNLQGAGEWP
jgi:RNA polymerase sigma factor for flagellar operon FliA